MEMDAYMSVLGEHMPSNRLRYLGALKRMRKESGKMPKTKRIHIIDGKYYLLYFLIHLMKWVLRLKS
jgi:hypothetical protein